MNKNAQATLYPINTMNLDVRINVGLN